MPDRDDKLRQAILGEVQAQIAEEAYGRVTFMGNEGQLADAILAAVNNVLEQAETVEWAPRYASDGSSAFASTFTEAGAKQRVAEASYLALYKRRCGPWERVPD